ncbi:hypothetical protein GA0061094_1101 [[Bacillus] enclensis]|uniref:Uncharacterized protein n=1 Tax=[Bacillus] enclensis TaxID=1402860 RepID=A0A1C3ZZG3_9BACI|nr:hypothetical protein GA0061094_1101 [[Bacillus] enclensis]
MMFFIGDNVIYNHEEYFVHFIYDSEYLEISKEKNKMSNCILVHKSEIELKK